MLCNQDVIQGKKNKKKKQKKTCEELQFYDSSKSRIDFTAYGAEQSLMLLWMASD
jgi:hypothetical protein